MFNESQMRCQVMSVALSQAQNAPLWTAAVSTYSSHFICITSSLSLTHWHRCPHTGCYRNKLLKCSFLADNCCTVTQRQL